MLFITDAALRVDEKRNEKFAALLGRIKDKGIFSVWTGMVDQSQEKPFAEAARLSGGIHVVSPDTAAIEKAMAEITTKIKSMPASDKMPVRAVIRARNIGGEAAAASDTILAKLPPAPVSDKKEEMKKLEYSFSDMPNQYTPEAADWIYGKAAPFRDVQITKHIQLSAEAENKAAKIKIQDVFLMKKMAGIQAPRGRQFAVLRLSLESILPEQDVVVKEDGSEHPSSWLKESNANVKTVKKIPPYLIPNLKNHIFINAHFVIVKENGKIKNIILNHTISKETSLSFIETLNKKYTINNIQFLLSSVMCAGIHGLKTSNYSLRKDY